MEMPQANENHAKLAVLAGDWIGEETLHPSPWSPEPSKATGKYQSRMALSGHVLITEYCQEKDGQVTYEGHGVIGWNDRLSCYLMVWSDCMGGVPAQAARGAWEGNLLRFQEENEMGHIRYTYTLHPDGSYEFALSHSQDGGRWSVFMDGHYHRQ